MQALEAARLRGRPSTRDSCRQMLLLLLLQLHGKAGKSTQAGRARLVVASCQKQHEQQCRPDGSCRQAQVSPPAAAERGGWDSPSGSQSAMFDRL